MNINTNESINSEKGFTLVELAIVMVIIGLLIGGVLKGQEMIANAQINATVAQFKGVDAATSTFRDMYDALPGDITNPAVRIPNCTGTCNANGDGNSVLTNAPGSIAGENLAFWGHLAAADLLSGIDLTTGNPIWGMNLPSAKIGGGLTVGYTATGVLTNGLGTGRGGHWIMLQGLPATAGSDAATAGEAARIDRKMDDGSPGSGSVISGQAVNGQCGVSATVYNEAADLVGCSISVRIQG